MSFSNRPLALIAALIAAGLCMFLALQFAALMVPFVLSSPYRWVLPPLSILFIALGGFWRARKKRKPSLQAH